MRHQVSNWSWREVILAGFAGAFLAAGAWIGVSARPASPAGDSLTARGAAVFRRERCFFCHTMEKEDGRRMKDEELGFGLQSTSFDLAHSGPDLREAGGRRTDDWHLAHLVHPSAVVAGSAMPSFADLPPEDLRALIAFLQSQSQWPETASTPEAVPAIDDTLDNYREGRGLYLAQCAGCHGEGGNGIGVVGPLLRPEPRDFTDVAWMHKQSGERLFAVIADGVPRTAMPGYRDTLSATDRARLVLYLRYFGDPVGRQFMEQGLPRPSTAP
ncbi:MAG: c-type cytochrome [Chloroflexi bacterium]|nr:c-type cytochrome [Chloroflexota bacterium]